MILLSLVTLVAADSSKASSRDECYHDNGMPRRCSPPFQNIAHERKVKSFHFNQKRQFSAENMPETLFRIIYSENIF